MDIYKQINYKGYNINIYLDPDPENPRGFDNQGTFFTSHHNYRAEKDFKQNFERDEVFDENRDFRDSFLKKYIALKVWLYAHGGVTIATHPFSCPWDSGLWGIIAVEVEKMKKEYKWKNLTKNRRIKIEGNLQSEVNILDNYYTGKVYGFKITPEGDIEKTLDSCWGYFGEAGMKQIVDESYAIIDRYIHSMNKANISESGFQYELAFS